MSRKITEPAERIRSAALSLFIRNGISGTTTKEIAREAGVSEGSIYNHYESKGDLALKLFISSMEMFREVLHERSLEGQTPAEKLAAVIEEFFDFARKEPEVYAYLMIGHYTELGKIPGTLKRPMDVFSTIIKSGIESGEFEDMPDKLGAAYVIGMLTRAILFHKNGILKLPYNQIVGETVKSSLKVLGAGLKK
jgi:AcrR family transcriptional regulator